MADPRLSNLARIIVDYSVKIRPGDQVFITTTPAATPLVQELYRLIVQQGGHALPVVDLPGLNPIFFQYANDEQLAYVSPIMKYVMENFDVRLAIGSQINTRELSAADPAKLATRQKAMRPVSQTFMDRSASGALRWNVTLFPTDAYAQDAEMSLADFEDFVYGACLCDQDDPVAAWREVDRKQQILVDYLKGKSEVHLVGEDTDVRVGIAGRTFVNCSGDKNMPDGEVFTGPEETRVNGHVRFSFPGHLPEPGGQRCTRLVRGRRRSEVVGRQERRPSDPDADDGRWQPAARRVRRSAPTSASSASSRTSSSTRRSAARSTWHSAAATRRQAR